MTHAPHPAPYGSADAAAVEEALTRIARGLARGADDLADELAQTGRVAAWQAAQSAEERGLQLDSPLAYVVTSARWAMLRTLNAHSIAVSMLQPDALADYAQRPDHRLNPEERAMVAEALDALDALTARDRKVVTLVLLGNTSDELADVLDVSPGHARKVRRAARDSARSSLAPALPEVLHAA